MNARVCTQSSFLETFGVEDERCVPARTMEVTVTGDHRVLDGAEVARFLKTLGESVRTITEADAWKPNVMNEGENK